VQGCGAGVVVTVTAGVVVTVVNTTGVVVTVVASCVVHGFGPGVVVTVTAGVVVTVVTTVVGAGVVVTVVTTVVGAGVVVTVVCTVVGRGLQHTSTLQGLVSDVPHELWLLTVVIGSHCGLHTSLSHSSQDDGPGGGGGAAVVGGAVTASQHTSLLQALENIVPHAPWLLAVPAAHCGMQMSLKYSSQDAAARLRAGGDAAARVTKVKERNALPAMAAKESKQK